MELRRYQERLIDDTRNSFYTSNRCLSVAPCGAGKTLMFAWMCSAHLNTHKNGYVWFLVHRQELIQQTIETFDANGFNRDNVLIAMVQTVSRHLDAYKTPSLIIFDEAHHSTATTWTKIIQTYPDIPTIGLTATPCRMDGTPLGNIYQSMVVGPSVQWLIDNNYLSHYEYYAPHIELEEASWQMKGKDYDQESVASKIDKPGIYGDIFKYLKLERKTIIYCPTIKYSQKLEKLINEHFNQDIARHFDGNTPDKDRKQIIKDFRDGKLRILLNVDLIGEGFDVPDCDCCMLLRPTMSVALYIQQSMRCMRYKPNKIAYIYDFVGNVYKHGLPSDDREWSLDRPIKIRNKSENKELLVRECKGCFKVYKGTGSICPYCGYNNGKTKAQIAEDKKAELERITAVEKKKERREVGMARSFEALVALAKKRGYRNPAYWAQTILNSRNNKIV